MITNAPLTDYMQVFSIPGQHAGNELVGIPPSRPNSTKWYRYTPNVRFQPLVHGVVDVVVVYGRVHVDYLANITGQFNIVHAVVPRDHIIHHS